MRELFRQLEAIANSQQEAVYCRLVETRGSTPQKAGATMLIYPDGSQAGTLGGGCVEAEVKRTALTYLEDNQSRIAKFQLDHDYGWDDGLICGGRMQILIQPVKDEPSRSYLLQLCQLLQAAPGFTEVISYSLEAEDSIPTLLLFDDQNQLQGSLGPEESSLPLRASQHLITLEQRPRSYHHEEMAFLPSLERCQLVIVGGGHVGQAVANMAVDLEFDVTVIDDRESIISPERFPHIQHRIAGDIEQVLPSLNITPHTYCLIVTRGHNHDQRALYHLADRGARYVGLIGSRRKIKLIFGDLLDAGISPKALNDVHAPLGIDIGSQTVAEIAVSICAELVSHRNRDGFIPGRPDGIELPA
jgi:xanthine dehydrogenase accessory factor